MFFTKVDEKDYGKVRAAKWQADRLHGYAKKLTAQMASLFALSHIEEEWGTSFAVEGDGMSALLKTPFGKARIVVVIGCAEFTSIGATYIFEKLVSTKAGRPMYKAVWAVRIDDSGIVWTLDTAAQLFKINAISKSEIENGVAEIALSAIYSIANDPGYFFASEVAST